MLVVSCSHAAAASPHPIPDAVFEFIKPFAKKKWLQMAHCKVISAQFIHLFYHQRTNI